VIPAGTGSLVRFVLRRERRGLTIWLTVVTVLVLVQSVQSQELYGTAEALANLRATTEGNAAIVAMSGPSDLLTTIGGEIVFEIFGFAAIVVALMNMFLVGRHTRAGEETGRAELLRSLQIDRRALLVSALAVAALADVAVAVLVSAVGVATGLPGAGSALFGVALGGVGLVFAGATAVAAQVFENTRGVYGTVTALVGLAFALRAAGDAGTDALAWLSPIGWGQRTLPFAQDRWWPVLLLAGVAVLAVAVALLALDRRDFGLGLVPARPGPARASRSFGSPLGLAWRLQRGPLLAWTAGGFGLGVMFGSIGRSIEEFAADNPDFARFLPGGTDQVLDAFVAVTLAVCALLAVGFGVSAALRPRGEETAGRAEPVLATATSRTAWLGGHAGLALAGTIVVLLAGAVGAGLTYGLSVSEPRQVWEVPADALAYVPAALLAVSVPVALVGLLPRAAAAAGWTLLGYMTLVSFLGDSFDLPGWARWASPLDHTPQVPLEALAAAPLLVLAALTAATLAAGLTGVRNRDIETP
jgi:ABC-2 type transport system permease protein